MDPNSAPIAVFDSGLGGITILKSLLLAFPNENFVYLGDTARVPYGSKSASTIRKYSEQVIRMLATRYAPKAIVIACNSASSQIHEERWQNIPLFNVIDPGVIAAVHTTANGRIGIMGTRATVQSGEYERRLLAYGQKQHRSLDCFSLACPLLVPLVEEGWIDDPITNLIVHRYVQALLDKQIDTLILGCTHYPILMNSIRRTTGSAAALVEAGPTLAEQVRNSGLPLIQGAGESGQLRAVFTDASERSQLLACELLKPIEVDEFSWVDLDP